MCAEERDAERTSARSPSPVSGTSADGGRPIVYVLYWQRWFILAVFSLLACHQVRHDDCLVTAKWHSLFI